MSAFFVDLDGTIFNEGTNHPLPGALETLKKIKSEGNQIIFTTKRTRSNWTLEALSKLGFSSNLVLFNIDSPRIVINDQGATAINLKSNQSWNENL